MIGKFFGRHYGTERFFALIFAFFFLICTFTVYGIHLQEVSNRAHLSDTVIYTPSYTWSRTGDTGNVVDVRTNSDNTKAFIMLHNGSKSSVNAGNYSIYMSGVNTKMTNKPTCIMYSYGNTGYFGILLTDNRGFASQVYSLIIRDDTAASIIADTNTFDPNIEQDQSFYDHNQVRLQFNLGSPMMEELECLDKTVVSPTDVYGDIVLADEYNNLNLRLINDTNSMRQNYLDFTSTSERLALSVLVPELPYYIASDVVDISEPAETQPLKFEPEMCYDSTGGISSNYDGAEIGETSETVISDNMVEAAAGEGIKYTDKDEIEHNYYFLHTDYLYPGCVDFEWQNKPLSYGMLAQAYAGGEQISDQDYLTYYAQYQRDKETYQSDEYTSLMPSTIKYDSWRQIDGSYVEMQTTNNSQDGIAKDYMSSLVADINAYTSALNGYMTNKKNYYTHLDELLALEYQAKSVNQMLTTNMDTSKFFLY